jgi:uncharacterized membrane protein
VNPKIVQVTLAVCRKFPAYIGKGSCCDQFQQRLEGSDGNPRLGLQERTKILMKPWIIFTLNVSFVLAAVAPNAIAREDPTYATIDFPGATSTIALDISPRGEIVGSYDANGSTHGFLLSMSGEFTPIDIPGANFTRAAAINGRGDIVGTYRLRTDPATARHGFLLSKGALTTIEPPGAVFTNPLGINGSGDIVGRFCITVPCQAEGANVHGFLLSEGEFTTIDIPGATGTNAWKINPRGDIVGGYTGADGKKHVFLLSLRKRTFITIDVPGAAETSVDNGGINSRGDIVGIYCDTAPCKATSPDAHGFLVSRGHFTMIDFPDSQSTNAFAINARGDIVGAYGVGTDFHAFLRSSDETDDSGPCSSAGRSWLCQ